MRQLVGATAYHKRAIALPWIRLAIALHTIKKSKEKKIAIALEIQDSRYQIKQWQCLWGTCVF
ncbi:MAG: hypothetical protein RMZ41_028410 [Nostoc sp. DedVER02]|uniref:hypothetical protein n=1 Tax=unclassified Nostoc TaxID=2593658 RepID=UPI002AD54495|nr:MULTISPECIES: hypothetical protein [unclassified Nostoc]MDZ7985560.1 hypothetical protein [Nostoc sp. DedVER02]MDZ8115268.1 hypothetical protein [Nostoc sp. DedVER01b]